MQISGTDWSQEPIPPDYTEILQENHYYPFGMNMEGPWHWPEVEGRENRYQYNGKEFNGDLGLGWNDYGARWYDPAVGRWGQVDPLADGTLAWAPYHYVLNNPMNLIDPTGMSAEGKDEGYYTRRAAYEAQQRKRDEEYGLSPHLANQYRKQNNKLYYETKQTQKMYGDYHTFGDPSYHSQTGQGINPDDAKYEYGPGSDGIDMFAKYVKKHDIKTIFIEIGVGYQPKTFNNKDDFIKNLKSLEKTINSLSNISNELRTTTLDDIDYYMKNPPDFGFKPLIFRNEYQFTTEISTRYANAIYSSIKFELGKRGISVESGYRIILDGSINNSSSFLYTVKFNEYIKP